MGLSNWLTRTLGLEDRTEERALLSEDALEIMERLANLEILFTHQSLSDDLKARLEALRVTLTADVRTHRAKEAEVSIRTLPLAVDDRIDMLAKMGPGGGLKLAE